MLQNFDSLERPAGLRHHERPARGRQLPAPPARPQDGRLSEGLSIPPAVQSHFRSVISEANRANVSVYAMDARRASG
jgi:hypothetical protein